MSRSRHFLFLFLGTAFWFNAAMIIRFVGVHAFTAGTPNLLWLFALAVPLALASMYLTALVSKIPFRQLLAPVVVLTFTATFWDAVALIWFRSLYSTSFEVALHGAAWILWGVGLGLLFAYAFHRPEGPPATVARTPTNEER